MKRAGVVAGIVLLLALTGCAQTPEVDAEAPSTGESTAPLVAESLAASAAGVDEAAFLEDVRENLPSNTQIPDATDEQLLAAGAEACQRSVAGESTDTISVIDGETTSGLGYYVDSGVIMTAAARHLACRS